MPQHTDSSRPMPTAPSSKRSAAGSTKVAAWQLERQLTDLPYLSSMDAPLTYII